MSRESLARLALRAYPADARSSSDPEVVGTLLDACDGSARAFLRELGSVLAGGLGVRRRRVYARPLWRTLINGVGLFAVADTLVRSVGWVRFAWRSGLPASFIFNRYEVWLFILLILPVLYALGRPRLAGLVGLAALVESRAVAGLTWSGRIVDAGLALGCLALILADSTPRRDASERARRLALCAGAGLLVLWLGKPPLGFELIAAFALCALPLWPALGIALSGVLLSQGLLNAQIALAYNGGLFSRAPVAMVAELCAVPATLLLTVAARQRLLAAWR